MKCKFSLIGKIIFLLAIFGMNNKVQANCNYCEAPGIFEPVHCFNVHGDFLYWKPTVTNLPIVGFFALDEDSSNETLETIEFNYEPGFRIGLGWQFEKGWDLNLDWTRLHSKESVGPFTGGDQFLISFWFTLPVAPVSISASQSIHYDIVNLDFIKSLALGTSFVCKPFFGPAGIFIHQDVDFDNIVIIDEELANQSISLENDFNGGGLRVGLESVYYPFRCFSLYGKGSFTLGYGEFKLNQSYTDGDVFAETFERKENSVVTGFDIMGGIRGCFCFCGIDLMAHVSYEFVLWPYQVRLQNYFPAGSGGNDFGVTLRGFGDVGFQGLTTGLSVIF